MFVTKGAGQQTPLSLGCGKSCQSAAAGSGGLRCLGDRPVVRPHRVRRTAAIRQPAPDVLQHAHVVSRALAYPLHCAQVSRPRFQLPFHPALGLLAGGADRAATAVPRGIRATRSLQPIREALEHGQSGVPAPPHLPCTPRHTLEQAQNGGRIATASPCFALPLFLLSLPFQLFEALRKEPVAFLLPLLLGEPFPLPLSFPLLFRQAPLTFPLPCRLLTSRFAASDPANGAVTMELSYPPPPPANKPLVVIERGPGGAPHVTVIGGKALVRLAGWDGIVKPAPAN